MNITVILHSVSRGSNLTHAIKKLDILIKHVGLMVYIESILTCAIAAKYIF